MKTNCLLFLLSVLLLLFSGCHSQTDHSGKLADTDIPAFHTEKQENTVSDSAENETTGIIQLSDRMTEDAEYVSSVRSYSVIVPENDTVLMTYTASYCKDGYFYNLVNDFAAAHHLYCYNSEGVLVADDTFQNAQRQIPMYAYRFRDGNFFVAFHCPDENRIGCFKLLTPDGTVLAETDMPDSGNTAAYQHSADITEREDGTFRIVYNSGTALFVMDESLTITRSIVYNAEYPGLFPLDENRYLVGNLGGNLWIADIENGTFAPNTELNIPDSAKDMYITFGDDGAVYCYDEVSVLKLTDDGNCKEILKWVDGSASYHTRLWVMDETHIYLPQTLGLDADIRIRLIRCGDESAVNSERRIITLGYIGDTTAAAFVNNVVALFNAENEAYYIELRPYSATRSEMVSEFEKDLLTGTAPDMMIFDKFTDLSSYTGKGVFADLLPHFGETLIGGVRDACTEDGAIYTLPLMMKLETFAALTETAGTALSYEKLSGMGFLLEEAEFLTADPYVGERVLANGIYDFIDRENKDCSFDSDEFRSLVRLSESLSDEYLYEDAGKLLCDRASTGIGYGITNAYLAKNLLLGRLKFLNVPYNTVHAYAALKMLFGEEEFTLCGYPSAEGFGAWILCDYTISLLSDSDVLGGCAEFLSYVLSDEVQTSDTVNMQHLPVTLSALQKILSVNRYYYFDISSSVQTLNASVISETRNEELAASSHYREIIITDEEIDTILNFFENCRMKAGTDSTILSITEEELSAYRSGAKSLEEVTALIQSRVWIYLNE